MKDKLGPWAKLARDFSGLVDRWCPIGDIDGRVYWTACNNFAQICREAADTGYVNPEMLKAARLMKSLAEKHLSKLRETGFPGQSAQSQQADQKILDFIKGYSELGVGPTIIEVAHGLGYQWESRVRTRLNRLETEGKVFHQKSGRGRQWFLKGNNGVLSE